MAKKKKTKKNKSKFSMIISTLFLILSCLLIYFLIKLQVLPGKLLLAIVIGLIILDLIVYLIMRFSRKKILKIIPLLGCAGLFYGVYSLSNTNDILTSMNVNYKTNNYVIAVKKDSSYTKLEDLTNKDIAYLIDDKEMLDNIKISYNPKEYEDVNTMVEDLLNNKADSIILEQSYIDMLNEQDSSIENFNDKVRIIYNFKVNTKVTDIKKDVNTTKDSFIIYISGIDTYGSVSSVSRTDANMLAVVNPTTNQILLVSIPRDYYVNLVGKNGKDKFTHSGIYGVDTSVKTLENLLDIDINYYFKINFTSLISIVDAVNGVDVYSKYTFTSKDGYNYKTGYNHVNGKEALSFVRERKAFNAGDRVRNMNQQALVEALLRKCTDPSIIVKYNGLLNSLKNSFITNMPSNSLTSLIKQQLENNNKWTVTSVALDGSNSMEYTYSYKSTKLYVMIPDQSTINNSKGLIQDVFDGKKLNSSYNDSATNIQTVTKSVNSKKSNSTQKSNVAINIKSNSNSQNETVIKNYTITYIIDEEINTSTVEEGAKLIAPTIPSKAGYDVLGWYLGDELYDFNAPVNSNLTLVATYRKIEDNDSLNDSNSNSNDIIEKQIEEGIIGEITISNSNTQSTNSNIDE